MTPYPANFPIDEVQVLLPLLRGQVPEVGQAVHSAWVIMGYGLSQQLPVRINAQDSVPYHLPVLDNANLAAELANLIEPASDGTLKAKADVPWDLIVTTLLALLRRWQEAR